MGGTHDGVPIFIPKIGPKNWLQKLVPKMVPKIGPNLLFMNNFRSRRDGRNSRRFAHFHIVQRQHES